MYEELYNLSNMLNSLCKSLPNYLLPPLFASSGCNLQLHYDVSRNQSIAGKTAGSFVTAVKKLPSFHNPTDKYDLAYWNTFTAYFDYEGSLSAPQHVLLPSFKAELDHLLNLVRAYMNAHSPKEIQIERIIEGHSRFNPSTGREYILHLQYAESSSPSKSRRKVLRLLRPLGPQLYVSEAECKPDTVHVILPLERVDESLLQFLTMYRKNGLIRQQKLHLIMVVFGQANMKKTEEMAQEVIGSFKSARVTVVPIMGNVSLTKAVKAGTDILKHKNDLIFIADVSLRISNPFYHRCHLNTILGKSVYYPVPFRMYSKDYHFYSEEDNATVEPFNQWSGHWTLNNFNFMCIRKQDYTDIGSSSDGVFSSELFEQIARSKLEVLQILDPALIQVGLGKSCSALENSHQSYTACQQLKQAASYDQPDLAEYLLGLSQRRSDPVRFNKYEDIF